MTPSRQEIDHPTSSSSSSTSPTTTVSSDSETRARENLSGIDFHPVLWQVNMLKGKNGETRVASQPKIQNQITTKTPRKNGETRIVPTYLNGSKNSEKISWMIKFLNAERDSHASSSHEPSLEPARSAELGKHSFYAHFPKNRNCQICQRTKITRAKTYWQSRTSCRKFWWFTYSRSQSSQWRLLISKQSLVCSRCAGLGHPMDSVVSVQNKNFSGNTKELAKVLGAE